MTRLINVDVAIKHIDDYYEMLKRLGKPSRGMTAVKQSIKVIINSLQTVDAVPVIRCKDCKHKNEYGYCTVYPSFHHLTADMDYCSDAERKEE